MTVRCAGTSINFFLGNLSSGTWFGAFPIPLDWDRPWQAWPITCVIGAVIGNALVGLSTLLTIRQLHNRSVRLDTVIAMICVAGLHLRFLVSLGRGLCLQRSAEINAPGYVNAAGKLRQKF